MQYTPPKVKKYVGDSRSRDSSSNPALGKRKVPEPLSDGTVNDDDDSLQIVNNPIESLQNQVTQEQKEDALLAGLDWEEKRLLALRLNRDLKRRKKQEEIDREVAKKMKKS